MNRLPSLHWNLLSGAAVAAALTGCTETVESTDIKTSGIFPQIVVTAEDKGTSELSVTLKVGGSNSNTYLDLKGDDRLTATVDGKTVELDQSGNSYRQTFDTIEEGTEFTISLERGEADESALNSTVKLPAPFDFELPGTEFSRLQQVDYSWDPPTDGDDVRVQLMGGCIVSGGFYEPDDGAAKLAPSTITTFKDDEAKSCTVTMAISRKLLGTLDPAFQKGEGGSIQAVQVRSDTFTSTP